MKSCRHIAEKKTRINHVILKIPGNCWTVSIHESEGRNKVGWFPLEGWVNEVTPQSWAVKVKWRASREACFAMSLWEYLNLRLLIFLIRPSKYVLLFDFVFRLWFCLLQYFSTSPSAENSISNDTTRASLTATDPCSPLPSHALLSSSRSLTECRNIPHRRLTPREFVWQPSPQNTSVYVRRVQKAGRWQPGGCRPPLWGEVRPAPARHSRFQLVPLSSNGPSTRHSWRTGLVISFWF